MSSEPNCPFCRKFGINSPVNPHWFDKELLVRGDLVVVAGLGPLAPGYVMIIPRRHYFSVSGFPEDLMIELAAVKEEVASVIQERFGQPIFFEHGPLNSSGRAGSCIDHAHIHVLPTQTDLLPLLNSSHHLHRIQAIQDLVRFQDRPYIYYERQNGEMYATEVDNIPGQYFRRILAPEVGLEDEWDYLGYPRYDVIQSTISKLSPWPRRQ